MRNLLFLPLLALLFVAVGCDSGKPYKMVDGRIVLKTPERPKGQEDMLLFAAEPIDVVRAGFIGLGDRGAAAPKRWAQIENTDIVAICDLKQSRIDLVQGYLKEAGRHPAVEYTGSEDAWKAICERDDIDIVYISTPWMT
ncbi:MAG: glycosyl hydrolase, partial [Alistipes sp.]|nr:glycosyl hydrolase [Alistipes sp.]